MGSDSAQRVEVAKGSPIVLISIDTLRSDRLPAYGYKEVETPAIDALRRDGILFERAYSPVPLTLPAHASLMTGLLPPQHGVRDNIGYRLDGHELPSLPRSLGELGYATGAAVSAFVLRRSTGIATGFDFYDDRVGPGGRASLGDQERNGGETLRVALNWVRSVADRPFFLFLHLYEPHAAYVPPEPFASRFRSPYDGEVAAADQVVGDLIRALKELGIYDRAIVVLLSDHGEGLDDHGESAHGILIYRESLQIPLIVKLPSSQLSGTISPAPAQLIDVFPTLLSLAGATADDALEGSSLLALLGTEPLPRPIYGETFHPQLRYGWSHLSSLIKGRYHYIQGPDPELYDLVQDPEERNNVLRQQRSIYGSMRDELQEYDTGLNPPFEADAETKKALLSLGYLASQAPRRVGPLPDPKSQLDTLTPLYAGMKAAKKGDWEQAVQEFQDALARNPQILDAWHFLGLAYYRLGRGEEALHAYQEAFRLSNGSPLHAKPLALLFLELGNLDEAINYLRLAIENEPEEIPLRLRESSALLRLRRLPEALKAAERTVELAPYNADAVYQRGVVKMGSGLLKEAEVDLRRALELAPNHTAAMSDLAVLLTSTGETGEARRLLERVLELRSEDAVAAENLGRLNRAPSR